MITVLKKLQLILSYNESAMINPVKRKYFSLLLLLPLLLLGNIVHATDDGGIVDHYFSKRFTGTTGTSTSFPLATGQVSFIDYSTIPVQSTQHTKKIKNVITFSLNEETSNYISSNFTAEVTIKIEYGHNSSTIYQIDERKLTVNYDKDAGTKYSARQYFHFEGAEYVKITIENVDAPMVDALHTEDILTLENEMIITRYFELASPVPAPSSFGHTSLPGGGIISDHLTVNWQWATNTGNNATQLEWVWLENELAANYIVGGNVDLNLLFRNNATRIDLPLNKISYDIPLLYDGAGKLYYRIRAVNIKASGTRSDGPWVMGNSYSCVFDGHNNDLNWQATTTFAEEGKRKTVVQYYDGSLRSRQTVTKDNTTDTIIVAETFYDGQGRPSIQILPSPGISNIIQYRANVNMFNGQTIDQDPAELFDLQPIATPNRLTPALINTSGSSQYYSVNNINQSGNNKNIPDADGYPYTVTRYTPDATGRVLAQSGVGQAHKMGSTHETQYYYGTPSQEELDGLFGTEVGNFTHYSKNMVKDANGQMSISYVDMHGRTIATALAGDAPSNLDGLDKNNATHYPGQAGTNITRNLLDNGSNVIKGNTIESVNTILVPALTTYNFRYELNANILQTAACEGVTPATLCYDCLYDLEIAIVDESGEVTDPLMVRKYTNVNLNTRADDNCGTSQFPITVVPGNDATNPDITGNTIAFSKSLPLGSYSIRKTLSINENSFQQYKDLYISKALCKTEQEIIDSIYTVLLGTTNCNTPTPTTCASCQTELGTYEDFKNDYLTSIGVTTPSAALLNEIQAAYAAANANCQLLCNSGSNTSPSLPTLREMMLADMIPYGGQYATETNAGHAPGGVQTMYNKYNIFSITTPPTINRPYFKNPAKYVGSTLTDDFYYDDQNNPDEIAHPDLTTGHEYDFLDKPTTTKEVFTSLFKNSWAKSLLPYHPEYKRLEFAEANLTTSYNWINKFSQVNTWAAASSSIPPDGFSDPLNNDPFFSVAPSTYKEAVEDDIANYQGMGVGMWELAYGEVKCKNIANYTTRKACYENSNPGNEPPSASVYSTFSATEKDRAWVVFRNLYMESRNRQVNIYIATQKPLPASDEDNLVTQNYRLWFPRTYQQTAQQNGWSWWDEDYPSEIPPGSPTGGPVTPGQTYENRCESYIQRWKTQLLQCGALANMSNTVLRDQILNEIVTGMKAVCVKGSDAANPNGSSTVKPSTPVDGSPRSFEEVINTVYTAHGINPPKDYYCNPYVIEAPKPYGKNPKLVQEYTGVVDSCACTNFASLKTQVIAAGYNPAILSSINTYLQLHNMDQLTAVLHQALLNCSSYMQVVCDTVKHTVIASCYDTYPCTTECYAKGNSGQGKGNNNPQSFVMYCSLFQALIGCYFDIVGATPTENCQPLFTAMYNDLVNDGHVYTWNEINSIHEQVCGQPLNICTPCIDTVICIMDTNCRTVFVPYILPSPQPMPDYLKCGGWPPQSKCLTCDQMVTLTNEFKTIFSAPYNNGPVFTGTDLTPEEIKQNILFARFLNFRTGFQFGWLDYAQAAAAATCTLPTGGGGVVDLVVSSRTGNTPAQYIASNSITFVPGFESGVNDEFEAFIQSGSGGGGGTQTVICRDNKALNDTTGWIPNPEPCHKVRTISITLGQQIYQIRKDYLLQAFDAAYKAKCLKAADIEDFDVTYQTSEYHYTLYYYDMGGNLVKTVPPKGVRPDFSTSFTNSVKAARVAGTDVPRTHEFITQYRYSILNQVMAKSTPDAGISKFWYDKLGRLVVSQNAQQYIDNKYSYILYDDLGRTKEVGQKPQLANSMSQTVSEDPAQLTTWLSGGSTKEQITRTTYDVLATNVNPPPDPAPIAQQNLRNRISYVQFFDTDPGGGDQFAHQNASYYSYDIHGNVDILLQDYKGITPMVTFDERFKRMEYDYDLISGKVNMVSYQPGYEDAFYHKYEYDAENRITEAWTSRDKIYWERDAAYQYYKHGALSRAELGQLRVQGIDHAYTLQGWLKGVNNTALNSNNDAFNDGSSSSTVAKDILSYALHYYDQLGTGSNYIDYTPIGGNSPFAKPGSGINFETRSLYNGNIAAMSVNNAGLLKLDDATNNTLPLFYKYNYDQLNRIKNMQTYKGFAANTNTWTPVAIDDYKEAVSYDPNGNIETYNRKGAPLAGKPTDMDDMTYGYYSNTNRLQHVSDNVLPGKYPTDIDGQSNPNNYTYDAIGNMVTDAAENISDIDWTVYGKIKKITKGGNDIAYTYDAAGNRVSKTYLGKTTIYVRDASGNVMSLYEYEEKLKQKEIPLYGSSRLGMLTEATTAPEVGIAMEGDFGNATVNTFVRGEKIFELSNHLGNVLVTVSDKKLQVPSCDATIDRTCQPESVTILYYTADVVTASDYYPFGMLMPGRKYSAGSSYRYGFNGKENDNEVKGEGNQQDYGLRIYDTRLGKFLSVDPNGPGYPYYTPYQFAGNTPIQAIDLDGGEPVGYSTSASFRHPGMEWLRTSDDKKVISNVHGNWYKMGIADALGANWIVYRQETTEIVTFGSFNKVVTKVDFHYVDNNCNAPAPGQNWLTNPDGSFAGNLVPFDAQERADMKQSSEFVDAFGTALFGGAVIFAAAPVAIVAAPTVSSTVTSVVGADASVRLSNTAIDYGSQVIGNYLSGKSGSEAWVGNINLTSLAVSYINPGNTWKKLITNNSIASTFSFTPSEGYNGVGGGKRVDVALFQTIIGTLAGKFTAGTEKRITGLTGRLDHVNSLQGSLSPLSQSLQSAIRSTRGAAIGLSIFSGSLGNTSNNKLEDSSNK